MIDLVEKRKKKEKLEIAERKVEKAWIRASKVNKKLKKAKRIDDKDLKVDLKDQLQTEFKRLKRNKKQLSKIKDKVM